MENWLRMFDRVVAVAARLLAIVVTVIILIVITLEARDRAVTIEEMSVPEEWASAGYTPSIVAHRILDEWRVIDKGATTTKRRQEVSLGSGQVDLPLPGIDLSLGSIVEYFKHRLGLNQERLRGGVVDEGVTPTCPAGCYTFLFVLDGPGRTPPRHFSVTGPKSDIRGLIQRASRAVVARLDPYLLANFYYAQSRRAIEPARAELRRQATHFANMAIASPPKDDDPWALTLLGALANQDERWADAIPYFDRALALNPQHASALNSRCFARAHLPGLVPAAIIDCRAALRRNPTSIETMDSLAVALERDRQVAVAYQVIQCAMRVAQRSPASQRRSVELTYQRLRRQLPNAGAVTPSESECRALMS